MKITSDTKKIDLVLAQFIEDLDFHVYGSVLSVTKAGFRKGVMQTTLGKGTIRCYHNLPYFGITSWPYTDGAGTKIAPFQASPNVAHYELVKMFENSTGLQVTQEESKIVRDSVIQAAAESPVVRAWSEKLDFEAFHAFDHVCERSDREDAYGWIAGDDVASQAMKKFVRDFPMLALAVFYGGGTYEAAEAGKTPEEAYKIAVDHVVANGLPCDGGGLHGRYSIGPMSMEFLDSIRGFKIDVSGRSKDESVMLVAEVIELARRLPVGSIPTDRAGFFRLSDCGSGLHELQYDDGDISNAFDEGFGFGMKLSDDEIGKIFADVAASKFASVPKNLDRLGSLQPLGCYGVMLAGHEDWIRKHILHGVSDDPELVPDGMKDFSALKAALVSDGFLAVYEKAVAFFKDAKASALWDPVSAP